MTNSRIIAVLSALLLASCAKPSANTIRDQAGREVTIVDTGVDQAGGPRLVVIGQFDAARQYHVLAAAHGPGSAQTLLPAVIGAAGFVGGMAALRPPQVNDTTTVSNATTQSGGGSSSSISPGAIVANGGTGGAGGVGGSSTSAGGSATAATAPVTATGGLASSAAIDSATSQAAAAADSSGGSTPYHRSH